MKKGIAVFGALFLASVTLFNRSIFGGVSLFESLISIFHEAPEPVPIESIEKQTDLENMQKGIDAMENEEYFAALAYFTAIPDDSDLATEKAEQIEKAAIKYLTDILKKADEELNYDNFNQAKRYLDEAIRLLPDSQELNDKYRYVLLRETLYGITCNDTPDAVLRFIQEHAAEFSNDSYVNEMAATYRQEYLNDISSKVQELIGELDYEGARQCVSEAQGLVGEQEKLTKLLSQINEEETKHFLKIMKDNGQWRDLIIYLDANSDVKEKNSSLYRSAYLRYKEDIIKQANEAIEVYEYQTAQKVLMSALDILYSDEEFMELYDRYKDYDNAAFRFCPIVNDETVEIEDAYDIGGTLYSNVIKIPHNQFEKKLVFRLPVNNYSVLSGKLFICQEDGYLYDEDDEGESVVTFYAEIGKKIKSYEGITYMNSVSFEIPISNVQYLTIEVEKTTARNVILGIGNGKMR